MEVGLEPKCSTSVDAVSSHHPVVGATAAEECPETTISAELAPSKLAEPIAAGLALDHTTRVVAASSPQALAPEAPLEMPVALEPPAGESQNDGIRYARSAPSSLACAEGINCLPSDIWSEAEYAEKMREAHSLPEGEAASLVGPRARIIEIATNRRLQVAAASAAGGAVAVGAGGGAVGFASGGVAGGAVGSAFALFTFGLSIPVGAAIGASAGFCMGAATGATAGFIGGGAAGYKLYGKEGEGATGDASAIVCDIALKQVELMVRESTRGWKIVLHYLSKKGSAQIKIAIDYVKEMAAALLRYARILAEKLLEGATVGLVRLAGGTSELAKAKVSAAAARAKRKASDLGRGASTLASDPVVRIAGASAAGGAVALGTCGGVLGLGVGTAAGGIIGIVPAAFTFALSIPVGATVGGGIGLWLGTAAGATAGFFGGGLAGYKVGVDRLSLQEQPHEQPLRAAL
jgi:hypothetical protein